MTIVRFEKKMKISVFIALETAKTGRVFNTKQESKSDWLSNGLFSARIGQYKIVIKGAGVT